MPSSIFASNRKSSNKLRTDQHLLSLREADRQLRARQSPDLSRFNSTLNLNSSFDPNVSSTSSFSSAHNTATANKSANQMTTKEYARLVKAAHEYTSNSLRNQRRATTATTSNQQQQQRLHSRSQALERLLNNAAFSRKTPKPFDLDSLALEKLSIERQRDAARAKSVLTRRRLFPDALPNDQRAQVAKLLKDPNFSSQLPGALVLAKDVTRLKPGVWLNNEIFSFWLTLINRRSADVEKARQAGQLPAYKAGQEPLHTFALSTFFLETYQKRGYQAVKRYPKKNDVFKLDAVLIPINLNNVHWVCAVVNIRNKRFEFYDSMGSWNQDIVDVRVESNRSLETYGLTVPA